MSDLDIESMRHFYESDTEWNLRKRFLEVHQDKFDARRLTCLASCFINVECYGCEYPAPLMIQLVELMSDIKEDVDIFRRKRAETPTIKSAVASNKRPYNDIEEQPEASTSHMGHFAKKNKRNVFLGARDLSSILIIENGFENTTIIDTPLMTLNMTEAFNKVNFISDFREEDLLGEHSVRCTYYLGDKELGSGLALTKQSAKVKAAQLTLDYLKQRCYTVIRKKLTESGQDVVARDDMIDDIVSAIPSSNIGAQMLKKLGWSGGGIGKKEQGIAEPVSASMKQIVHREGLGLDAEKGISGKFLPTIQSMIHKYASSTDEKDLVFANDFTKEERAIIHKEAQKIGLKSQSYGKGDDRHITLSRKRNPNELYKYIAENGGETDKYRLVAPRGK